MNVSLLLIWWIFPTIAVFYFVISPVETVGHCCKKWMLKTSLFDFFTAADKCFVFHVLCSQVSGLARTVLWSASALFGRKCDRSHCQHIQPHYGSGQGEVWFLHRSGIGHQLQHLHRRQLYSQEERTSEAGKEGIDACRYWPFSEYLMHITNTLHQGTHCPTLSAELWHSLLLLCNTESQFSSQTNGDSPLTHLIRPALHFRLV